jgi:ATPase subunit of ABC transporter with duplicated ATPase domains
MLAQLNEISLSFPDKSVLDDVSLTVYPRDRRALVGENGSGKTSLFRILTGHLKPDAGDVSFARGLPIGHLGQDSADLDRGGCTFLEVALEPFACLIRLEQRIDHLGAELAKQRTQESTDKLLSELRRAQRGAWRQR